MTKRNTLVCVQCGRNLQILDSAHITFEQLMMAGPLVCSNCASKPSTIVYSENDNCMNPILVALQKSGIVDKLRQMEVEHEPVTTAVSSNKELLDVDNRKSSTKLPEVKSEKDVEVNDHTCVDCGKVFQMTSNDENWYLDKGFKIPKRCKECRTNKSKDIVIENKIEHVCVECGESFYMTERHEKWFRDKKMPLPTRCQKCVNKRKRMAN